MFLHFWLLSLPAVLVAYQGGAAAGVAGVQIVGSTNTQAVLRYTAPDENPCRVEVSDSPSLRPLVHDVDPLLFPGADLDNRPGAQAAGPERIFVVGQRLAGRAADGNIYSRALQTYTTHYYRITCGSGEATGSFTTANIPLGMTYVDLPPQDPLNPGQQLLPTLPGDRVTGVVDPRTGAYIKLFSLPADKSNPYLYFSGAIRTCGNALVGPGPGFLCTVPGWNGGYGSAYYVIPATGEVRYLGVIRWGGSVPGAGPLNGQGSAYPYMNAEQSLTLYSFADEYSGKIHLLRGTYVGDFSEVPAGAPAAYEWQSLTAPLNSPWDLIHNFDPAFDPAMFRYCGMTTSGNYGIVGCTRGGQDTYGWMAVIELGQSPLGSPVCSTDPTQCPRVIAASNVVANKDTRWCSLHGAVSYPGGVPLAGPGLQNLADPNALGGGPYFTTLASAIAAGDTTLSLTGPIVSGNNHPDDVVPLQPQVGDAFLIQDSGGKEVLRITAILSPTSWQVSRGQASTYASAHYAGSRVYTFCKSWAAGGQPNWKFLEDPHGANYLIDRGFRGGHTEVSANYRIVEAYSVVAGPLMENLGQPITFDVDSSPLFAGARAFAYGNTYATHPSMHQDIAPPSEQTWFFDMRPFDGGIGANPGALAISGQLYRYVLPPGDSLARKQLATIALSGARPLVDISGPGSYLSDTPADSFKYCVAYKAGECRPGSQPDDIYANVPDLQYNYCYGADGPTPDVHDLCITKMSAYAGGVQFGFGPNSAGEPADAIAHTPPLYGAGYSRMLTQGLTGSRDMFYFASLKALPDASWGLFTLEKPTHSILMVKIPPFPAPDNLDRATFLRLSLALSPPSGKGVASAYIRFGYGEQGPPSQYYCTSRREACVVAGPDVEDAAPFLYEYSDSFLPLPCPAGCTIAIPVLPAHVVFYQVVYLDADGQVVSTDLGAAAELSAATLGGVTPVNNTPTGVTLLSPAAGQVLDGTVTLSASVSGNAAAAGVQFLLNGAPLGVECATAPYTLAWDTTTIANGSYTLAARVRDAAGGQTTSAGVAVTVNNRDATPPSISLTAPAVSATSSGTPTVSGTVTVTAAASDNVGVAGVQFLLNGAPLGAERATAPYTLAWNTASVANGAYTLAARARDAAGNQATSTGVAVTVNNRDATAPSISLSAPAANATVSGTVTLTAAASDNVGLAGVQFLLNGAPLGAERATAPYALAWDTTTVANGTYTLAARARDAAGNQAASAAIPVTVANSGSATPSLWYVALAYTSVQGGQPDGGRLVLTGPAPAGGVVVRLSSSNPAVASLPASVTIPAGGSSASFSITTSAVGASTPVSVSASCAGAVRTVTVTVLPPALSFANLAYSSITGGLALSGRVGLTGPAPAGGAVVRLSSTSPAAASTPSTLLVAAGSSSAVFSIATAAVSASTPVVIAVSYAGVTKTAPLIVLPPALSYLNLSYTSIAGGATLGGNRVGLTGPAPAGGVVVSLSSSGRDVAAVPATVVVPAGSTSATFSIATAAVSSQVTISASCAGVVRAATLTVIARAMTAP